MLIRGFVAYDFAIAETGFVNVVSAVADHPPPGFEIQPPAAPDADTPHGTVWNGLVRTGIQKADRVLAFIDLRKSAAEREARHSGTSDSGEALEPLRPVALAGRPRDPWPEVQARFIGRQRQLVDAGEAVEGLQVRFSERREARGARGVKLIWAHGFGGMGKSWFLHRVRRVAVDAAMNACDLIVDFDPRPTNEWRYPSREVPSRAETLFDPIAYRLAQRVGVEAVDPYWLAKARVAAAAEQYRVRYERFQHQLRLAKSDDEAQVEPELRQLLKNACTEGLWQLDAKERARRIARWSEEAAAVGHVFEAWCHGAGIHDDAAIAPDRVYAEGLCAALRAAMQQQPIVLLLDTLEVLAPELHIWLRELLVPLLSAPEPLLVLVGSRLRPDLDQRSGSRRGWLVELPAESVRVDAFAELLRFDVNEIEDALAHVRPMPDNRTHLAEQLHRVSLGVPLGLRTLLDLHEQGDGVLSELAALETPDALRDSDAIKQVIATAAERLLLHLAENPNREDDYRAIVELAVLTSADHAVLRRAWGLDHTRGEQQQLAEAAEIFKSVADRAWWRPWADALDVVVAGRSADTLTDPKARELAALISGPPRND